MPDDRNTDNDPFTPSDLDKFRIKVRTSIIDHLTGTVEDQELNELLDELGLERTTAKVAAVIQVEATTIMTPEAFGEWLVGAINDLGSANAGEGQTIDSVGLSDYWEV